MYKKNPIKGSLIHCAIVYSYTYNAQYNICVKIYRIKYQSTDLLVSLLLILNDAKLIR